MKKQKKNYKIYLILLYICLQFTTMYRAITKHKNKMMCQKGAGGHNQVYEIMHIQY